jgi:hypothetical protein
MCPKIWPACSKDCILSILILVKLKFDSFGRSLYSKTTIYTTFQHCVYLRYLNEESFFACQSFSPSNSHNFHWQFFIVKK